MKWFSRQPKTSEDPVFGKIIFTRNRRNREFDYWTPAREVHFAGRIDELEDFTIYAGEEGPSDHQRDAFRKFVDAFSQIEMDIEQRLWEDYSECDPEELLARFSSSSDLYSACRYRMIEVFSSPETSTRGCDIHLAIEIPWESDHGRAVHVLESRVIDLFRE